MTTRLGYALGFLACAGLLAFAYYLEYVEHQEPCPLCMLQRLAYVDMMIVFAVRDPFTRAPAANRRQRLYSFWSSMGPHRPLQYVCSICRPRRCRPASRPRTLDRFRS